MAGYSGKPLAQKLGLKSGMRVVLLDAPPALLAALGPLHPSIAVVPAGEAPVDGILLFAREAGALEAAFGPAAATLDAAGMLWVGWPKKAAKVATDLTEDVVRAIGLRAGLVDVKVCAIDEVWSGLKFVRRLADRPGGRGRA